MKGEEKMRSEHGASLCLPSVLAPPRRAQHLRKPSRRVSGHKKTSLFLRLWSCERGRNLK